MWFSLSFLTQPACNGFVKKKKEQKKTVIVVFNNISRYLMLWVLSERIWRHHFGENATEQINKGFLSGTSSQWSQDSVLLKRTFSFCLQVKIGPHSSHLSRTFVSSTLVFLKEQNTCKQINSLDLAHTNLRRESRRKRFSGTAVPTRRTSLGSTARSVAQTTGCLNYSIL